MTYLNRRTPAAHTAHEGIIIHLMYKFFFLSKTIVDNSDVYNAVMIDVRLPTVRKKSFVNEVLVYNPTLCARGIASSYD